MGDRDERDTFGESAARCKTAYGPRSITPRSVGGFQPAKGLPSDSSFTSNVFAEVYSAPW